MSRNLTLGCLAALAMLAALTPGEAVAGGYDVYACDGNVAGGANNSFAPAADPNFTAYSVCPPGDGMVARDTVDPRTVSGYQSSSMVFEAPPGTSVGSIHFYGSLHRGDCSFGVGIYGGDIANGLSLVWGWNPEGSGCLTDFSPAVAFDYAVNAATVRLLTWCGAASCTTAGDAVKLR